MKKIDLHLHSNLSDGEETVENLIMLTKKNECDFISITDHDLIGDYKKLGEKYNINIVNGIEFNTSIAGLHILGYNLDNIDSLNRELQNIKDENELICFQLIDMLSKDGYDISIEQVIEYIKSLGIVYNNMDKRKIVKYLIAKKYTNGVLETYDELIGREAKYYIPNKKLTPIQIIELINKHNGVSVLAHPYTLTGSNEEIFNQIKNMRQHGLDGLEVMYNNYYNKSYLSFADIATNFEMIMTSGSDFHQQGLQQIGIEVENKFYDNVYRKLLLKK